MKLPNPHEKEVIRFYGLHPADCLTIKKGPDYLTIWCRKDGTLHTLRR